MPYHLTAPFTEGDTKRPLSGDARKKIIASIREAGFSATSTFELEAHAKEYAEAIKAKLDITMQMTHEKGTGK